MVRAECCRCHAKFDLEIEMDHPLREDDFVIGFECPACVKHGEKELRAKEESAKPVETSETTEPKKE